MGTGIFIGYSTFHNAATVFATIFPTVEALTLNKNDSLLKNDPVARYLQKARLGQMMIFFIIYALTIYRVNTNFAINFSSDKLGMLT